MKLLFLCTGNTCRSPMAAALARQIAAEQGLALETASAGLAANPGEPASLGARQAMEARRLSLEQHRAQRFHPQMAQDTLVLTMTAQHAAAARRLAPRARIQTLAAWAGIPGDIEDPYGADFPRYAACAAQLESVIRVGLRGGTRPLDPCP